MATAYPTVVGVTFKDIPGFPGYCAGDDGSIWSRHCRGTRRLREWRKRKITVQARPVNGCQIDLLNESGNRKFAVGRLILSVFVGPCPDGMECCHNDGDPTNNRLENLRWDTHVENMKDKIRHGTVTLGEMQAASKLTDAKVREVFRLYSVGWTRKKIADRFEVDCSQISRILDRHRWKHVGI